MTKIDIISGFLGAGKAALSSQDVFCKEAMEAVPKPSHGYQGRVFIPAEPVE